MLTRLLPQKQPPTLQIPKKRVLTIEEKSTSHKEPYTTFPT